MSTQIPWVLPLNIKAADVDHWKLEIKAGENLTFWALEKGRLDWSKYQQWAMEFYQLCSIHDDYFREPAPLEFWKLIQSVANWSPSLLPLEQWDGIIFIGCVEPPPADLHWSFPVQYVLASPTALKTQWQKYNQPVTPEIIVAAPALDMDSLSLQFNNPPPAAPFTLSIPSDEGVQLTPAADPDDGPVEDTPQAPEGLAFELGTIKKVELAFDLEVSSGPSTPEEMINSIPTATGDANTPPPAPELNDTHTMQEVSLVINMSKLAAEETVAIQPPNTQPDMPALPSDDDVLVLNVDSTTESKESPLVKSIPVANPIEDVKSEEDAVVWAFTELKKYFDQSMFLKFDGTEFQPVKWSEGWQPKPGAEQLPIKIDTPSLFRIVVRTQHSYHGKIMPTPAHDIFFKNWSQVGIPEIANAIAISLDGKIYALLLSVGAETSNESAALEYAEKVAGRLQQKIIQFHSNQAA